MLLTSKGWPFHVTCHFCATNLRIPSAVFRSHQISLLPISSDPSWTRTGLRTLPSSGGPNSFQKTPIHRDPTEFRFVDVRQSDVGRASKQCFRTAAQLVRQAGCVRAWGHVKPADLWITSVCSIGPGSNDQIMASSCEFCFFNILGRIASQMSRSSALLPRPLKVVVKV